MRLQIIKTGEILNADAAYGVRLIEQGKAIIAPAVIKPQEKKAAAKPAEGK